jgi:hypothetical protein
MKEYDKMEERLTRGRCMMRKMRMKRRKGKKNLKGLSKLLRLGHKGSLRESD